MELYYFDSSATVKNYVTEIGTNWVKNIFNAVSKTEIYSVSLSEVEVVAAFARRQKGKTLSATDATAATTQFKLNFATDFRVVSISSPIVSRAVALAETRALRGYDAVHLAAALELFDELNGIGIDFSSNPFVFVSADKELNAAATAEGLTVDNPINHP